MTVGEAEAVINPFQNNVNLPMALTIPATIMFDLLHKVLHVTKLFLSIHNCKTEISIP